MMLQFEGERTLHQDSQTCWTKLSDPRFLSECIPNAELAASVGQSGPESPSQAQFRVRPGVSFVRGTLDVTIKVEKGEPGKSARYSIHSRAIGSSSDAEALLELEPVAGSTHLRWKVEIKTLGGLLKAVPQGLIKASAQKVVADIWSAVEKKLTD
jgi:carbon monoxide dehydrogenase subunit G